MTTDTPIYDAALDAAALALDRNGGDGLDELIRMDETTRPGPGPRLERDRL